MLEFPRSVAQFCRDTAAVADAGRRSDALMRLVDLVRVTNRCETSIARVLSSRQLDGTCLQLGRTDTAIEAFDPEQTVFLVTFLSRAGGHTRLLRDLIDADPGRRATILVSNVLHDADVDELRGLFSGTQVAIEVAPAGMELAEVVSWIQQWLVRLRAERAYILQHPFDATIPAAVQPGLVRRLFYVHNCDHSLALGVHIPHATHVDLHGKGFHICREREGVAGNVHWPLAVPSGEEGPADRTEPKLRRTCTSGGSEKFEASHFIESVPYLLEYPEVVATILAATGGTHHHVGGLSEQMVGEIRRRLQAAGIHPDAFVHVPFVPRLSDYFRDEAIDVYVTSMPLGGGRALIEVMAAGLPVLLHSNYRSVLLTDQAEAYPGVLTWRDYDELARCLHQFDRATLDRHAAASRSHYQARYRPKALQQAVGTTLRKEPLPEPDRFTYHPDALQTFLDERAALDGSVRMTLQEFDRRNAHVSKLEELFRDAEKLAVERLAEMARLDHQLLLTDQALARVTQLALDRLAEIEALHRRL